jgi:hypothetical protein
MEQTTSASSKSPTLPAWSNRFLEKGVEMLGRPEIRLQIQSRLLDPILQHVMRRVIPYIILTCVLFVLLLIAVLITLGLIVFQLRSHSVAAAVAAGVGAV